MTVKPTPITTRGLTKYDHLDPADAALQAWANHGNQPAWHEQMRADVRAQMPLLGRALDRMEKQYDI